MKRTFLMIAGVLFAGCSGVEVSQDYDPNFDFSKLKSWGWMPTKPGRAETISRVSTLNHERIRKSIEGELTGKHYRQVDQASPDFLVQYHASVGQRLEESTSDSWTGGDLRVYDAGTLVIDIVFAPNNRLVWRGAARTEVDFDMTPEDRDARIHDVVRSILQKFPPKK